MAIRSKITTLRPKDYSEARTIGERFRDGSPVIMDLVSMDNADAKRLVDFAAGLASRCAARSTRSRPRCSCSRLQTSMCPRGAPQDRRNRVLRLPIDATVACRPIGHPRWAGRGPP